MVVDMLIVDTSIADTLIADTFIADKLIADTCIVKALTVRPLIVDSSHFYEVHSVLRPGLSGAMWEVDVAAVDSQTAEICRAMNGN